MTLKNSLVYINQFFFFISSQARKIYLNSNIYNKKISRGAINKLIYKPSPSLLNCLIKYSKKIDIKNFVCENIYTNFIIFLHSFPIIFVLLFVSDFKFQLSLFFAVLGLLIVLINLIMIGYLITIMSAIYKDYQGQE